MSRTDPVFDDADPLDLGPVSAHSGELLDQSAAARDARAAAQGRVVVFPGKYNLFVDIDGNRSAFNELLSLAQRAGIEFSMVEVWPSKRTGHYHAHLVTVVPLTPELRVAMQAALGSDPKREVLSLASVLKGDVPSTVFFESAAVAAKLVSLGCTTATPATPEDDDIPF